MTFSLWSSLDLQLDGLVVGARHWRLGRAIRAALAVDTKVQPSVPLILTFQRMLVRECHLLRARDHMSVGVDLLYLTVGNDINCDGLSAGVALGIEISNSRPFAITSIKAVKVIKVLVS